MFSDENTKLLNRFVYIYIYIYIISFWSVNVKHHLNPASEYIMLDFLIFFTLLHFTL